MKIQRIIEILKRTIITLSALTVIFALIFGSLVGFFDEYAHRKRGVTQHTQKA